MWPSVIISVVLHVTILLAGAIALPSPTEFEVTDSEAVPVDIINLSDITKSQAETPADKPKDKPKPAPEPEPERQAAVEPEAEPEPEPEPEVTPEPEPQPEPEAAVEPEPAPEPEPEAEPEPEQAKPKPVPRPRARPKPPVRKVKKKKPKFDPDRIAALLNKDPALKEKPQQREPEPEPAPGETARLGRTDGVISQDEKDALRAQIEKCWNPLVGVQNADELVVRLKIWLKRDGTLERLPEVVNSSGNPAFGAAADRAVRAVRLCQPFNMPANKYSVWREIILNFNPRDLIRG